MQRLRFLVFVLVVFSACKSSALKLLTWDASALQSIRNTYDVRTLKSPDLSASLLHLWQETETTMNHLEKHGIPSVVDKKETVPGANGDKSYYTSVVPYAFPCNAAPMDCKDYHGKKFEGECSKSGLPWIICDGHMNIAARDATDRPRLERMMNSVMRLSLAGYILKDPKRSSVAASILRVWFLDPKTRMRPSLRFGQGIPGVTFGRSSACMDLYFSGRGFVDGVLLLAQTPGREMFLTEEDIRGMRQWASEMALYLNSSDEVIAEGKMANNHGVYYDLTVLSFALLADDDRSLQIAHRIGGNDTCWTEKRAKTWCLEGRFASQIDSKGIMVHEINRADAGHYVWYTLLANAHLAIMGMNIGNNAGFDTPHLRLAAEWALPHVSNGKGAKIEGRHLYAAHAYRILSRGLKNDRYEEAVFSVLTYVSNKPKTSFWSPSKVGLDVLNIVMPPISRNSSTFCKFWSTYPQLVNSSEFYSWYVGENGGHAFIAILVILLLMTSMLIMNPSGRRFSKIRKIFQRFRS